MDSYIITLTENNKMGYIEGKIIELLCYFSKTKSVDSLQEAKELLEILIDKYKETDEVIFNSSSY